MLEGFFSYIKSMFEEFLEFSPVTIAVVIMLFVICIGGAIFVKKSKGVKFTTRMLVYASICIAVAFVLSYIRLWRMPQGGSITPASMLPIVLFAVIFGPVPGTVAGAAYGMLQLVQGAYVVHWAQLIIEYPLAFGLLGLAGIYRKNLVISCFIGIFARFTMHFLAGMIFFSEIAGISDIWPAMWTSLVYNGSFLGVEFLISAFIVMLPQIKRMTKQLQNSYFVKG